VLAPAAAGGNVSPPRGKEVFRNAAQYGIRRPGPCLGHHLAWCLGSSCLTLTVMGFEPGENALSGTQAEEVRLTLQNGQLRFVALRPAERLMDALMRLGRVGIVREGSLVLIGLQQNRQKLL
jgi:hypothetical protein